MGVGVGVPALKKNQKESSSNPINDIIDSTVHASSQSYCPRKSNVANMSMSKIKIVAFELKVTLTSIQTHAFARILAVTVYSSYVIVRCLLNENIQREIFAIDTQCL